MVAIRMFQIDQHLVPKLEENILSLICPKEAMHGSLSASKRNAMKTTRMVAILSYLVTPIIFFATNFTRLYQWKRSRSSFSSFFAIPFLPLRALNLEEHKNNIFFQATSKSLSSFGFNYFFIWIGSALKIEANTFLKHTLLSFLFYLIANDYLYDIIEDVELCDNYLFA